MARLIPPIPDLSNSELQNNVLIFLEEKLDDSCIVYQKNLLFDFCKSFLVVSATNSVILIFSDSIVFNKTSITFSGLPFDKTIISKFEKYMKLFNDKLQVIIIGNDTSKCDEQKKLIDNDEMSCLYININNILMFDMDTIVSIVNNKLSIGDDINATNKFLDMINAKDNTKEKPYNIDNYISSEQMDWRKKQGNTFVNEPKILEDTEDTDQIMLSMFSDMAEQEQDEHKDIILDVDGHLKKVEKPENGKPFIAITANNPFMLYVKKVLISIFNSVNITFNGYEITVDDMVKNTSVFPAVVVATSFHWAPVVIGQKNKGGFTAHIKRDAQSMLGYSVTGLELSSPLLFIIPMIDVLNKHIKIKKREDGSIEKELLLEPLLLDFRNFLSNCQMDLEPLDKLDLTLSNWE